jgi:3-hydroxy-9,10-secoandrosta-1,3,5(10)-triene-9,17-dione monooxygenase reductase component
MATSLDTFDNKTFRSVLGHFASGVTVVTGGDCDNPSGFTCQGFSSLSLDPPLIVVLPRRVSTSWSEIACSGRFCVNVLAEEQEHLSACFAQADADKFADVSWTPSPLGSPILDGVSAWIDCELVAVHEGGDHFIVLGAVHSCHAVGGSPLVFHRGRYLAARPRSWFRRFSRNKAPSR